jgi:hypothetical protein
MSAGAATVECFETSNRAALTMANFSINSAFLTDTQAGVAGLTFPACQQLKPSPAIAP